MQAIVTKYIGSTDNKSARVKAACDAGSVNVKWDNELSVERNHLWAAMKLIQKLGWVKYGDPVMGSIPATRKGGWEYAFVFRS